VALVVQDHRPTLPDERDVLEELVLEERGEDEAGRLAARAAVDSQQRRPELRLRDEACDPLVGGGGRGGERGGG
jgi:hypothetical protein